MKNVTVEKASIKSGPEREGWHVVGALDDGKGPTWSVFRTHTRGAAEIIRQMYLRPGDMTDEELKEAASEIQSEDQQLDGNIYRIKDQLGMDRPLRVQRK